jgi:hypothetical protein
VSTRPTNPSLPPHPMAIVFSLLMKHIEDRNIDGKLGRDAKASDCMDPICRPFRVEPDDLDLFPCSKCGGKLKTFPAYRKHRKKCAKRPRSQRPGELKARRSDIAKTYKPEKKGVTE